MDENAVEELSKLHGSTERILDVKNVTSRLTAMDDVEEFIVGGEDMTGLFQQIKISAFALGEADLMGIDVTFSAVVEEHPRFIGRTGEEVDVSIVMTGLILMSKGTIDDAVLVIENPMTEHVTVVLKKIDCSSHDDNSLITWKLLMASIPLKKADSE